LSKAVKLADQYAPLRKSCVLLDFSISNGSRLINSRLIPFCVRQGVIIDIRDATTKVVVQFTTKSQNIPKEVMFLLYKKLVIQ